MEDYVNQINISMPDMFLIIRVIDNLIIDDLIIDYW